MRSNNFAVKSPSWESGDRYGNVILTGKSYSCKGERMVEFICKCKNIGWTRLNRLKRGTTKSCGCLINETTKRLKTTHGLSHHPLYKVWASMIDRCSNKNNENYGGKGVKVCEEWKIFKPFYDWALNNGYKSGLQLDKDKKAPNQVGMLYCPEFCSFITGVENSKYKDYNKMVVEYRGVKKPVYKWCKELGLSYDLIKSRIKHNWDVNKAFENKARPIKLFEYNGNGMILKEWCNLFQLNYKTIRSRLNSGWEFKEAIEIPIKKI